MYHNLENVAFSQIILVKSHKFKACKLNLHFVSNISQNVINLHKYLISV